MTILGVNLREISLKREDITGKIKIKNVKNNINIIDVKKVDLPQSSSGKALIFSFEFVSDYEISEPKKGSFGKIRFVGDVVFSEDAKKINAIHKQWKKNKKIDDDILFPILQVAMDMINVEAIYLSRKVMLPSPVKLPQIKPPKSD
jgi:hypothetical protein